MAKFLNSGIIFVIAVTAAISLANKCVQDGPCHCKFDEYSQINLTQVLPSKSKFIQDSDGNYTYFFSGCKDQQFDAKTYKLNSTQSFTASLVKCNSQIYTYPINNGNKTIANATYVTNNCTSIGNASQIKFEIAAEGSNDYQIVYNVKSANSLPSIRLVCDNFDRTDLKIAEKDADVLTLYSPSVCIKHISHHDWSTGSTFCIIFFTAAIIYFVGGGLIMYFARGARGVEVIPNFDFWVSLPGLIRDGLVYILSGCRPFTVTTAETYDKI